MSNLLRNISKSLGEWTIKDEILYWVGYPYRTVKFYVNEYSYRVKKAIRYAKFGFKDPDWDFHGIFLLLEMKFRDMTREHLEDDMHLHNMKRAKELAHAAYLARELAEGPRVRNNTKIDAAWKIAEDRARSRKYRDKVIHDDGTVSYMDDSVLGSINELNKSKLLREIVDMDHTMGNVEYQEKLTKLFKLIKNHHLSWWV